jgi:GT2 family glycosyltransferase
VSSVRPPFILCFAGDSSGCGWHRIIVPLMSMVMPGHVEGRLDLNLWPVEMVVAVRPDTVVFQRYMEEGQLAVMQAIRAALPDALLVYELDDYLGEVPAASFHAGFMPPDMPAKIARAAAVCDRVTTSTESLAAWFCDELHHPDVRVVGNAVPAAAIRPRPARETGRLRIGFAGGISHDGDLEFIRPAMETIGDAVEWVFFGAQPKNPPVRTEFHPGVSPGEYQAKMLTLDIDLMLAPLESNRFNECKSNLRLIEAGMVGAAVIAQRMTPYTEGDPPVFAYASTPQEWIQAIEAFVAAPMIERQLSADALQRWVKENHTLEKRLPSRIDAWLKHGEDAGRWKPGVAREQMEKVVASLADGPHPHCVRHAPRKHRLVEACARAASVGADVLWLRPGVALDDDSYTAMRTALTQTDGIASAVPLAADGPNAFPRVANWTPIAPDMAASLADALREDMPGRRLIVGAPSGPAVLLSAKALAALGYPDVEGCDGNEEQAIMEWGLRAAQRGWKNMQAADAYAASLLPPMQPTQAAAQRLQLRGYAQSGFAGESLTEQERADAELAFLRARWAGPQPGTAGFGHDYMSWSSLRGDLPIPVQESVEPVSLSVLAFGTPTKDILTEWVVFVDDTIEWHVNGLATLRAACADASQNVAVVYADNEFRAPDGNCYPDLKPDFDLELFLARDYVTSVCALRTNWMQGADIQNRTALFDFVLAVTAREDMTFLHVPKTLASVAEATPEDMAMAALGRQMVIEYLYGEAVTVKAHAGLPGCLSVVRHWDCDSDVKRTYGTEHRPLVSIIVPTLGAGRLIQPCVNTIRQHTRYPNYEIIVVQNGERAEPELGAAALADDRVRIVRWEPAEGEKFNWSKVSNDAVREHAQGRYLLFMNDDVCVGAEGWLDAMMGQAVRPDVGAVGARLVHPAGMVQHVGVICHRGIAGHLFKGMPNGQPGNGWLAALTHEASAVTGACLLVSRAHFDEVGGFDEVAFPMNYGDVDFCLKLCQRGLRNVVEMTSELLHPEGTSRTDPNDQVATLARLREDNVRLAERWPQPDPYWHPDLSLGLTQGGLSISGLNRELLLWQEQVPARDAKRVLVVNDLPGLAGCAVALARKGEIVFSADLSAFTLRLVAPLPANSAGWDIREPRILADALRRLGIGRVVLRSLVGSQGAAAPHEAKRCLAHLDVPIEIDAAGFDAKVPDAQSIAWGAAYDSLADHATKRYQREEEAA